MNRGHDLHLKLGRIRCVKECIDCFSNNKPLPKSLCYIPSVVEYKCLKNTVFPLYSKPSCSNKESKEMMCGVNSMIVATGVVIVNKGGEWTRVKKYQLRDRTDYEVFDGEYWMQLPPRINNGLPNILQHVSNKENDRFKIRKVCSYEDVIDCTYSLSLNKDYEIVAADRDAVARLRNVPDNWCKEKDKCLVNILSKVLWMPSVNMGTLQNYIDAIEVSSPDSNDMYSCNGAECLFDGDEDSYWQSDGHLSHWIRLHMKRDVIISKLSITVDHSDLSFLPRLISVICGTTQQSTVLNNIKIERKKGKEDVCLLSNVDDYYELITIQIEKNHSSGVDSRIHAVKIESLYSHDSGIKMQLFDADNLINYPLLQPYSAADLLARATVLTRFMAIVDSVMTYILPPWQDTEVTHCDLRLIRHVLPLSKVRLGLIDSFITQTSTKNPEMTKVCIDRRFTRRHRDLKQNIDYKQSIFYQTYEGLHSAQLDFRWKSWVDQWWVCVFLSEGLDDHGGGFRDCISDIAEELCPSEADVPIPTPFFIRSSNHNQDDMNINVDTYVPSPSCKLLREYTWIGQLMGACIRSSENLVLSLPEFVWKKLLGEEVTWTDDFYGVDPAEVKYINKLTTLSASEFDQLAAERKTWTTLLSDGTVVTLRYDDSGACAPLVYSDLRAYSQAVIKTRLAEFDTQIDAIRQGLLSVIPQAVLNLLTSQELERRICGEPNISVDDLWKCFAFDTDETSPSLMSQYLRSALENFTNEERSRFVKFVTGRRRLPVTIHICELDQTNATDFLPEATTCAGYIYLPNYTSAKVAEDKLRYAIYNCITIDTDE